jgi:hypothetical protein
LAESYQDHEDQASRRRTIATLAVYYDRRYTISARGAGLLPTRGETVTLRDVTGSGLAVPRVHSYRIVEKAGGAGEGGRWLNVRFYQLQAYGDSASNLPELRGRSEGYDAQTRWVTRFMASTDGSTDIPTEGTAFPGDSGDLRRVCVSVGSDTQAFPGLHLHVVRYEGYRAYS